MAALHARGADRPDPVSRSGFEHGEDDEPARAATSGFFHCDGRRFLDDAVDDRQGPFELGRADFDATEIHGVVRPSFGAVVSTTEVTHLVAVPAEHFAPRSLWCFPSKYTSS